MPVWGIVVAAGTGERFGGAKQFSVLAGRRIVDRSVEVVGECCPDGVVVVIPPEYSWDGAPTVWTVPGGPTRSASVRHGLDAVPDDADVVVVHDAARPLARPQLFDAVIDAVRAGADGAVPGIPVPDTVKAVRGDRVLATLPREHLVAVQTPQAFRAGALRSAHTAGADAPDDAALVEAAGGTVVVVPGDPANLKITRPIDVRVARVLLES